MAQVHRHRRRRIVVVAAVVVATVVVKLEIGRRDDEDACLLACQCEGRKRDEIQALAEGHNYRGWVL